MRLELSIQEIELIRDALCEEYHRLKETPGGSESRNERIVKLHRLYNSFKGFVIVKSGKS